MSVSVVQVGLACCAVEATALDLVADAQALAVADESALAHVLVVAGTVTRALGPTVARAYDAVPEPRIVVAFGACAISGGPYWDSYSVTKGVDQIVPVDVYIPGCPPRPEALIEGIVKLQEKIAGEDIREKWSGRLTAPAADR